MQQQVAVEALDHVPSAPEWLKGSDAREHWDRVLGLLVDRQVVSELDLGVFALLCHIHGQILAQARSGGAMRGPLISKYIALCNEFGLTPASAHKVHPLPTSAPVSGFSRYRKDAHERD